MIQKTELPETLAPFRRSPFGCRICSTAEAYGLHEPFAQIWTQGDRAALCLLDDAMILDADDGADFEEIRDFVRMSGARSLLCSEESARRTGFLYAVRGEIMRYENLDRPQPPAGAEWEPSLRELYALLRACETPTFTPPEFEPFYLDLSHRIRHGTARTAGIRLDGELVSCAVCSAKTEEAAVVSSVAAKPALRRKGHGRAALAALLSRLEQNTVYIFRAQGENEAFYRAFGFTPCGAFEEQTV